MQQGNDSNQGIRTQDVQELRKKYGWNELAQASGSSWWHLFLIPVSSVMGWVLIAAMAVSFWLDEWVDAWSILAIVLLNAVLEAVQERRAEKALASLRKLSAPQARVQRDGHWSSISSVEVLPGDLIRVSAGDRIPADLRWVQTEELAVDESMLSGESLPIEKNSDLNEVRLDSTRSETHKRQVLGAMGTLVVRGQGTGVVTAIGKQTEMGQIANLLAETETPKTPLQIRLAQLGHSLVWTALTLTGLVVLLGWLQGHGGLEMMMAGVSLAVAAIPEGLPAIVTVALALGVQRMIQRQAIVRKLPSVETLGCATVICTDKTGTLTENQMTVCDVWTGGKAYTREEWLHPPVSSNQSKVSSDLIPIEMVDIASQCHSLELQTSTTDGSYPTVQTWGDPTEQALYQWADALNERNRTVGLEDMLESKRLEPYRVVRTHPFDSERKRMSVIQEVAGNTRTLMKGAVEEIMASCEWIAWNGKIERMTAQHELAIQQANALYADRARRVLAFALKNGLEPRKTGQSLLEQDEHGAFIFYGLVGMIDPPRSGVKEAIFECAQAGVRTVMITGDHPRTAAAIASEIGLLRPTGRVLSGSELEEMNDQQLSRELPAIDVFARVNPAHKLRIVQAFRKRKEIVAMTGDGVNDAPALKAADIGVAMGRGGTDVAKEASALILRDDHFATIVAAIREGRTIYENIRKFIRYLLASNVGEIVTMLFALLFALPLPLLPIQILWVNLVTDGLPALALGVDGAEADLMRKKPRRKDESIFADRLLWKIISRGLVIGILTVLGFVLTLRREGYFDAELVLTANESAMALVHAQTVAFAILVLAQLIHVFDCRSQRSILDRNPFENKALIGAVVLSALMMLGVIYIDLLQPIFGTMDLDWQDGLIVFALGALPSFLFAFGGKRSGHQHKAQSIKAHINSVSSKSIS